MVSQDVDMAVENCTVAMVDQDEEVAQPMGFRCCPLGVQYYSKEPVEEFATLEMDIEVPTESGELETIPCHGAVVHCEQTDNSGMYRVWVLFVDLDKDVRDRLECMSSEKGLRCVHCMNF